MGIGDKIFGLGALLTFDEGNSVAKMGTASKAAGELEGRFDKIGKVAQSVGRDLSIFAVGASAIGATLGYAASRTVAWSTGMARINTLLSGQESNMLPAIGRGLESVSQKYGLLAEDAQVAMFQAISAAVPAADSLKFMDVAARSSVGGTVALSTSVDGLTNTLNAFGLEAKDAEVVADKFFVANKRGKTTFAELAATMGGVAPTFAAAGGSVSELTSAIARVTKVGIGTAEATTGIKMAITGIIKPAAEAATLAKQLGLEFNIAGMRKAGGFIPFLEQIDQKTKGDVVQLGKLFGSVEAVNAITAMTARGGLADLKAILQETEASAGQTQEAYLKMADTPEQKMKVIRAQLDGLWRKVGELALPAFDAANRLVGSIVKMVEENEVKVTRFFAVLGKDIKGLAEWVEGKGSKGFAFILDHAEGILAATKGMLALWVKIRVVQLSIAAIQTGSALFGMARGGAMAAGAAGAGGGAGMIGMLGGSMAAGGFLSFLKNPVWRKAGGEMDVVSRQLRAGGNNATYWLGGAGQKGELFARLGGGAGILTSAFAVAGAALAGWQIGQWLNSMGADELIYKALRVALPGGGKTIDEENTEIATEESVRARVNSQRKLAWWARFAATQSGSSVARVWSKSKSEWTPIDQTYGKRLARTLSTSKEQLAPWQQEHASSLSQSFVNSMREGTLMAALSPEEMRRGRWRKGESAIKRADAKELAQQMMLHPGDYGLSAKEAPTASEISRIWGDEGAKKEGPKVNVQVPVTVNLDGKKVGEGLGLSREMETRRGADDGYSLADRSLIVRGGMVTSLGGFRPSLGHMSRGGTI